MMNNNNFVNIEYRDYGEHNQDTTNTLATCAHVPDVRVPLLNVQYYPRTIFFRRIFVGIIIHN